MKYSNHDFVWNSQLRLVLGAVGLTMALPVQALRAQQGTPLRSAADTVATLKQDASLFRGTPTLVLVNSDAVDRARWNQLRGGVGAGTTLLLRSTSSLTPRRVQGSPLSLIAPQLLFVSNTAIPFSQNDGALWAGKGSSNRVLVGFRAETGILRVIIAPEFVSSANSAWQTFPAPYRHPPLAPDRNAFSFPYYVGIFSIDQPVRYGDRAIRRMDPGQSAAVLSAGRYEFGFSTEHEWWGPGIRNAIVLSNNAPGFPHLFARTAQPFVTPFGYLNLRWLVGGLAESRFFDTVSTNNVRSLSSFATTLQPAGNPNLTFGAARSVYANARGWGQFPLRWLYAFARTHGSGTSNRDQLFSLFARWVLPADGFEVYSEWARLRMTPNLRELITAPNHTQGYTLGMQWRGGEWWSGAFRVQTEVTQLEQSATWRDRPGPSWYASDNVVQGYTNRGEILGASIGPGASSQWLAIDYIKPKWRFGGSVGRIRWNEDVHSNAHLPVYVGYCSHDVTVYPGVRGASWGRFGELTVDALFQNRMNLFFENDGGCPNVGQRRDVRNRTLSITYTPFRQR